VHWFKFVHYSKGNYTVLSTSKTVFSILLILQFELNEMYRWHWNLGGCRNLGMFKTSSQIFRFASLDCLDVWKSCWHSRPAYGIPRNKTKRNETEWKMERNDKKMLHGRGRMMPDWRFFSSKMSVLAGFLFRRLPVVAVVGDRRDEDRKRTENNALYLYVFLRLCL